MIVAFFHGFMLALGLILPLGVQNVFVFNQGAAGKKWLGALPAVVTAGLCDTLLIVFAVMGVSMVVLAVDWLKTVLFIAGACFMIFMGWSLWKGTPGEEGNATGGLPPVKQAVFAMSVSLLNPHAILDTVGVIGSSSLNYAGIEKYAFTLATVLVSWIWFAGLAIAGRYVGRISRSGLWLRRLNLCSAVVIWIMAAYLLVNGLA